MESSEIIKIQKAVLSWYQKNGRHDLPWRNLEPLGINRPYGVMVSEFMLQQTQVERVIVKYKAFLHYYPTVKDLAEARPSQVVTLWSGLGYNRRAIFLQKAAQAIELLHGGVVPSSVEILESLPGVGRYTAAAIAAFGYNAPVVVMDTNIERFYELLFFGYAKPTQADLVDCAEPFIPKKQSCLWHSALMDLMSQVRLIKSPLEQQKALLEKLNLKPTWPLPVLTHTPLKRPKQSTFKESKRYFRGRIVAYLGSQPKHQATFSQLNQLMKKEKLPAAYDLAEILEGLKKDGLVTFVTLKPRSLIRLP